LLALAFGVAVAFGRIAAPFTYNLGFTLINAGALFALLLLPLRFALADRARDELEQRQLALMSLAVLLYACIPVGVNFASPGPWPPVRYVSLAGVGAVAGLWLWNTRAGSPAVSRLARTNALLVLGLVLVGMALRAVSGSAAEAQNTGANGLARTLGVLVLAYAILRHQLLGIDLKVKWGIRQSTVAAAFVGVFFVVSESASTFFAESVLGPYLGIAAAGLLIFAMAPLQRAAEGIANAAMPGVRAPSEMAPDERLSVYRDQLRAAYADGAVDRSERMLLESLRARLAISAEDALRIEREVAP
jgi:uncharacterized membrane protein YebE (DUF533 family)